ncbi:helix-turn-helix domain-containing protein [Alteribacillus sp. HJP-4]
MSNTECELLTLLTRYSVKLPGISWLKVKTMAANIGRSQRTINYALASLEKKGIIKRVTVYRVKGGNSSNITVIIPPADTSCRPSLQTAEITETAAAAKETIHNEAVETTTSNQKQEKINIEDDKMYRLFRLKMIDKTVQYGSSYMDKVINTILDEKMKTDYKKRLHEDRQKRQNHYPGVDWLEQLKDINYRTSWLDS